MYMYGFWWFCEILLDAVSKTILNHNWERVGQDSVTSTNMSHGYRPAGPRSEDSCAIGHVTLVPISRTDFRVPYCYVQAACAYLRLWPLMTYRDLFLGANDGEQGEAGPTSIAAPLSAATELTFCVSSTLEIWEAPPQHCCRSACWISKGPDDTNSQSHGDNPRDLTTRLLIEYRNSTLAWTSGAGSPILKLL